MRKLHIWRSDDLLDHSRKAASLARNPTALRMLRAEILKGIEYFMWELELQCGEKPEHADSVGKARGAAEAIRTKPLEWFAEQYDWMRDGAFKGSASLLKEVGKIGR